MSSTANIPASVRQRLLNRARSEKRPFGELLQYFAMERFLYRLSKSPHAGSFVLKGALMLRAWGSPEFRPTKDIDLLGITSNVDADIISQIRDVIAMDQEPDGLAFDPNSIQVERITTDAEYEGVRVRFKAKLDTAKIGMQIDIGFGDTVHPEAELAELPVMLDFPAPRLLGYTRESAIAEKFEVMIKLGELNSRMKDFFDIWLLSRQFDYDISVLGEAIRLTFRQRGTSLPSNLDAFTEAFLIQKQVQWTAFLKRTQLEQAPISFKVIVFALRVFLEPVVESLAADTPAREKWIAPGPWS